MKTRGEFSLQSQVPNHLQKYVVEQNYSRYTEEDQAVWRYLMRQLKSFLSVSAHECYVEGLRKTGIEVDHIPHISEMDQRLSDFGWGAVPVSGFIPPAAFMEFQSLGLLPIACDMRTVDHLAYTPAPDIVHEAAGHAPILIDPKFASYLKKYAEVARNALLTREDLMQYEAIRRLSDIKENPDSSPKDIALAEHHLIEVNQRMTQVSEGAWLSRMNWWTAEYGLIGSIKNPKIFGAGLLSSLGESRECLSDKVKKIPLSLDCIQYAYDITEPQPQLFVTPDFEALSDTLEQLAQRMSFRIGGEVALQRAKEARTLNTVELDSGLQISGELFDFTKSPSHQQISFLKFNGPCTLSLHRTQLQQHGTVAHPYGFSTPLGRVIGLDRPLSTASEGDLNRLGLVQNQLGTLKFDSGIEVRGTLSQTTFNANKLVLISWDYCEVRKGTEILFQPDWGQFDMAVGERVVSVFSGPADLKSFSVRDDFIVAKVPSKGVHLVQQKLFEMYGKIRSLRLVPVETSQFPILMQKWNTLCEVYFRDYSQNWLLGLELYEASFYFGCENCAQSHQLIKHLQSPIPAFEKVRFAIVNGLKMAKLQYV